MRASRGLVVLLAATLLACGHSTETTAPPPVQRIVIRGMQFVSGNGATDTVRATLPRLYVEVHDTTGVLAPTGTPVRFSVVMDSTFGGEVFPNGATSSFVTVPTDQAGVASVSISLGFGAGNRRLAVSVPSMGLQDTARYTVLPGSAYLLAVQPTDTVAYVGSSVALRGVVRDAYRNARNDSIIWTSPTGATVSSSGVVEAGAFGNNTIVATAHVRGSTLQVNSTVHSVPHFRLIGWDNSSIVLVDADGSHRHTIAAAVDNGTHRGHVWPISLPDHSGIIYSATVGGSETIIIADTNGVTRTVFPNGIAGTNSLVDPAPTSDRKTIYFGAATVEPTPYAFTLYRAGIDGSSPTAIGDWGVTGSHLAPQPLKDGRTILFTTNDAPGSLWSYDIVTRAFKQSPVYGNWFVASPDGTQVAYESWTDDDIHVMAPDFTGSRLVVVPDSRNAYVPVAWTPDSKYLISKLASDRFQIVRVSDGLTVPLATALNFTTLTVW